MAAPPAATRGAAAADLEASERPLPAVGGQEPAAGGPQHGSVQRRAHSRSQRLCLAWCASVVTAGVGLLGFASYGMPAAYRLRWLQALPTLHEPPGQKVLYVVYSDSLFYESRVKWVLETWGSLVPRSSLVILGDAPYNYSGGHVVTTQCEAHTHWIGVCCKYAQAVLHAWEIMRADPSFSWAFFVDDDAYVRPAAVERLLASRKQTGVMLGISGCGYPECSGLCGGGGYVADRQAIQTVVESQGETMVSRNVELCRTACKGWADIALTQVFRLSNISLQPLEGLYGWSLNKVDFDKAMAPPSEPLMLHYIRTESAMMVLHDLFQQQQPNSSSHELEGNWSANDRKKRCATFKQHTVCGKPGSAMPWSDARRLLNRSRYERPARNSILDT